MNFTRAELLGCVQREINMRKKVYRDRVRGAKMSKTEAEREIAMMEEVLAVISQCKCSTIAPLRFGS